MSINRNTRSSSWAVAELLLPGGRIPGRNGDIWNSSRGCNPFWLMAQQPCGKPLVSILRQWLPCYDRRFRCWRREHRQLVGQINAATLDRLPAPARSQPVGRGRHGTKPSSLLRSKIAVWTAPGI
jgi:hypothetical protein